MAEIVRHKKQLNINISPYLMKEIDDIVAGRSEFSGYSDFCTIAITQFIERYRLKNMKAPGGS
jgi:metal-responsive CopG/Arc/MetJ family transcriptional regulator